jgi:hypothetical protein
MTMWQRKTARESSTHESGNLRYRTHLSRLALDCMILLAALLLPFHRAIGQTQASSATLSGSVSDSTGAVIPGASVTAISTDQAFQRQENTNGTGLFVFTLLPPGHYSLTVQKAGLSVYTETNITLEVGQSLNIPISLSLASVSEKVTVSGETPQLNTEDANLSTFVNEKDIVDLPLNQRAITGLVFLNASVTNQALTQWTGGTSANQPNADQDLTFLNFAGSRFGDTEFLLDGHWDVDPQWGGIIYSPGVDETQEFRLQTNSFSAQFGFSSGNVVNMVTKSGTSSLHGDAFEFLRNSAADARNFFDRTPQTHFERNQFGFTLGGPVVLPRLYHGGQRTFFFGSYEGLRAASPVTATDTVPSLDERSGDFSALLGSASGVTDYLGRAVYNGAIYDPYSARQVTADQIDPVSGLTAVTTGTIMDPIGGVNGGVPTNVIPSARFDKLASTLLPYYPKPTNNSILYNNFTVSASSPQQQDAYTVRIDHNINDRSRIFGRFSNKDEFKTGGVALFGNDPGGPGLKNGDNRWDTALGYSQILSQSLVLSVNLGWNRWIETNVPQGNPFDVTQLGWLAALNVGGGVFPGVSLGNGYAGLGSGSPQTAPRENRSIGADLTDTHGRHLFTFGVDLTSQYYNNLSPGNANLSFGQGDTAGFDPVQNVDNSRTFTGNSFASFLLGVGGGSFGQSGSQTANMKKMDGYLQDDWKVNKKLTLNLGVRYEIQTSPTDRFNKLAWFDPAAKNPITATDQIPSAAAPGALTWTGGSNGRNVITNSYTNFAPRFGFSYHPTEKLVVRGAYGVFYPQRASLAFDSNLNGYSQTTNWVDKDSAISGNAYSVTTPASQAFSGGLLPIVGSKLGGLTNVGTDVQAIQHNWSSPYVQDYTFGLQYALSKNDVVEATYVGNRGRNLPVSGSINLNQVPDKYIAQAAQAVAAGQSNPDFQYVLNPYWSPTTQTANGGCGLQGQYVWQVQLYRPYPEYCNVNSQQVPVGIDNYNALMITWTHHFSRGFQVLASYNRSKWLDDVTGNAAWSWGASNQEFRDNTNIRMDYSVDASDVPNSLVVNYIYQIPLGRGKAFGGNVNKAVDTVVGGWQFSGISTFRNGVPLSLTENNNNSYSWGGGQTPNQVHFPNLVPHTVTSSGVAYFDPTAFAQAPNFTWGNTKRNLSNLRGPGTDNFDLSLQKYFTFRDNFKVQIRGEAFDAFNHPRFTNPDTGLGDAAFGTISGAFQPREVQAAVKLLW